jgi:zinc/manganese transport system permease protein
MPTALASLPAASSDGPTWDLVADLEQLFHYHFMQSAFIAGTLVALVAGVIGYFMVLRGQSFAGHTLANVGFAGAAGAVLLQGPPVVGLLVFGAGAALGIGALGGRQGQASWRQDIAVGTVLAFSLGLGRLFTQLSSGYVGDVTSILFGAVLGINDRDVATIGLTTLVTLGLLALVGRPLLFASVDPDVAAARGVPVRALSYLFLVLLAFAVAQAVQVVGVLLIFALLVTPGAIAQQLSARPALALTLSVLFALLFTWAGLAVAYFTPYPVGFFVTTFAFGAYALVRLIRTARAALMGRWPTRMGSQVEGVVQ